MRGVDSPNSREAQNVMASKQDYPGRGKTVRYLGVQVPLVVVGDVLEKYGFPRPAPCKCCGPCPCERHGRMQLARAAAQMRAMHGAKVRRVAPGNTPAKR